MATVGRGWDIPPEADAIGDFRWFKVKWPRTTTLVVLSHEASWYRGHFWNGRMIPCAGEQCVICARGIGAQVRFVFAAADVVNSQVGLMEVGRSVGLELRAWSEQAGQLRGMVLEFSKHSKSDKSRTEMKWIHQEAGGHWMTLPIPDIGRALKLTWERGGSGMQEAMDEAETSTPDEFGKAVERVRKAAISAEST